jgi:hypothetical protein
MRLNRNKTTSWSGTFQSSGKESAVALEFKGHGRMTACNLPGIKLEFSDKAFGKGVFDDDKVNLTTHCEPVPSDTDGFIEDPQLEVEDFAARECAAYSVVAAFGIPAFKTWIAEVNFADPKNPSVNIKAMGCFIEKPKTMAKRVGGELEDHDNPRPVRDSSNLNDPPNLGNAFRKDEFFRAALAQSLFGNIDYGFYQRIIPAVPQGLSHTLRNTKIFRMPDKTERPGIHDFDLSVFVRGAIPGFAILTRKGEEIPDLPAGPRYHQLIIQAQLERLAKNNLFKGLNLREEASRIFFKKAEIMAALELVPMGPKSRALQRAQTDAFFEGIDPNGSLNPLPGKGQSGGRNVSRSVME